MICPELYMAILTTTMVYFTLKLEMRAARYHLQSEAQSRRSSLVSAKWGSPALEQVVHAGSLSFRWLGSRARYRHLHATDASG